MYLFAALLGIPAFVPTYLDWGNEATRPWFLIAGIFLWAILFLRLLGYYGYRTERKSPRATASSDGTKDVALSLKMQIGDARLHDMTNVQSVRQIKKPDGTERIDITLYPRLMNLRVVDIGHTASSISINPARIQVDLMQGEKSLDVFVTGTAAFSGIAPSPVLETTLVSLPNNHQTEE